MAMHAIRQKWEGIVRHRTGTANLVMRRVPMARYFFNLRESIGTIRNPEGAEYPDVETAVTEAIAAARDLMSASLRRGDIVLSHAIEITDNAGTIVETVEFADAVTLR